MLTLNSNILKIGNKWVIPHAGSGPTPPGTVYQVTTSGTHGTVTASPTEGITGTEVTLSNTPDTHYHFGSYSLTGATLKNANQFDIADSDVSVVGNFIEDTKYSVTCTNDGNGTIAASPTSNYSGSTVTLSNTPNSGYDFDKYTLVSGTGASISGNTLTIGTSNVTVRGDFVAQGASGYKYFVLKLTGFESSISGTDPTYNVCTFKYNNSAPTSTNFRGAGYYDSTYNSIRLNPASQTLNMLVNTTPAQSPYSYEVTLSDISSRSDKALYIAVGTDTEASSCALSWKDFLETLTSSASCTIKATLYGTNTISGSSASIYSINKNDLTQIAQASHSCGYYFPPAGVGSMSTGTISWTA